MTDQSFFDQVCTSILMDGLHWHTRTYTTGGNELRTVAWHPRIGEFELGWLLVTHKGSNDFDRGGSGSYYNRRHMTLRERWIVRKLFREWAQLPMPEVVRIGLDLAAVGSPVSRAPTAASGTLHLPSTTP